MKMKLVPLRAAALLATVAGFGVAPDDGEAAALACHGCNPAHFEGVATSAGFGNHFVYDLMSNRVQGFSVSWERELSQWYAMPFRPSADVISYVDALSDLYYETGGTMEKTIIVFADDLGVPGLGGASAWDVSRDANLRGLMANRIGQGWLPGPPDVATFNRIVDLLGRGTGTLFGFTDFEFHIRVTFIDGSFVEFKLVPDEGVSYMPDLARDAENNIIPMDNSRDYAGTYNFTNPVNLYNFSRHLQELGIPVTNGGGGSTSIRCSWDGKTLLCRFVPT